MHFLKCLAHMGKNSFIGLQPSLQLISNYICETSWEETYCFTCFSFRVTTYLSVQSEIFIYCFGQFEQ